MSPDPRVNILLVDDQPGNLHALEAILEGLGQNLVKARSGEEALRRLLDDEFAVILMDVRMPSLNGLETAALIREREKTRHIPIIFLTAYEKTEVQMFEGYCLGAVDFLCKPLVPEILRSKVAVFVELCQKTEQVKRQAELLRDKEHNELENKLASARQRWEMERLRQEAEKDKQISEALAQKADELARLNRTIQEADRHKDEFLAMLGHELRNPLAPMLNALHILRLNNVDATTVERMQDLLQRQVQYMSRLIDDLLDVSRISRGKIELRKQPLALSESIAHAVESTRALMEERGHRLEVTLPPESLWIEADPTRLEQVLANLLNNAAKYTEAEGQICVSAEKVAPTAAALEGEVLIKVRDSGIGIPRDMLGRVFELFTRVDPSRASAAQFGMGIGLALVRTVVELHGGTVEAHSAGSGQGSEFVVRLTLIPAPLTEEPLPVLDLDDEAPLSARVLLVDDNKEAVQSLSMLLAMQGHRVSVAYDGPAALETARADLPEIVLLDIGLPEMSGYEVAQRLRSEQGMEDVPLIALTGYGLDEDRVRSQEAGFDYHLVKPVDPIALQRIIARSLSASRAQSRRGVDAAAHRP